MQNRLISIISTIWWTQQLATAQFQNQLQYDPFQSTSQPSAPQNIHLQSQHSKSQTQRNFYHLSPQQHNSIPSQAVSQYSAIETYPNQNHQIYWTVETQDAQFGNGESTPIPLPNNEFSNQYPQKFQTQTNDLAVDNIQIYHHPAQWSTSVALPNNHITLNNQKVDPVHQLIQQGDYNQVFSWNYPEPQYNAVLPSHMMPQSQSAFETNVFQLQDAYSYWQNRFPHVEHNWPVEEQGFSKRIFPRQGFPKSIFPRQTPLTHLQKLRLQARIQEQERRRYFAWSLQQDQRDLQFKRPRSRRARGHMATPNFHAYLHPTSSPTVQPNYKIVNPTYPTSIQAILQQYHPQTPTKIPYPYPNQQYFPSGSSMAAPTPPAHQLGQDYSTIELSQVQTQPVHSGWPHHAPHSYSTYSPHALIPLRQRRPSLRRGLIIRQSALSLALAGVGTIFSTAWEIMEMLVGSISLFLYVLYSVVTVPLG